MQYPPHKGKFSPFFITFFIIYLISALGLSGFAQGTLEQIMVKDRLDSIQQRVDSLRITEHFSREESKNEIKIKLAENRLTIENLSEDGLLEIYNIMGAKVFNRRIKTGTTDISLSVPRGYYIIKIGKFSRKIAIK